MDNNELKILAENLYSVAVILSTVTAIAMQKKIISKEDYIKMEKLVMEDPSIKRLASLVEGGE